MAGRTPADDPLWEPKPRQDYGISSSLSASALDASARWSIFAMCNPANMGRVQQAIREELDRALKSGFTAQDLQDAKTAWRQGTEVDRSQDMFLAMQLGLAAEAGRTLAFDADLERKVLALDPGQVLDALRRHLDLAKLVVVKAGDFPK